MDNTYILSKEDKNAIEISNLTEENINLKKQNARNEGFSSESKEKKHVKLLEVGKEITEKYLKKADEKSNGMNCYKNIF